MTTNPNATVSHRDIYGTHETGGLVDGNAYHKARWVKQEQQTLTEVDWTHPGLKITRLRLVSDPGYPVWDVSYCHGVLPDGSEVDVGLPFSQLPKRNIKGAIIEAAKRDKVYAKNLGIFDVISKLV